MNDLFERLVQRAKQARSQEADVRPRLAPRFAPDVAEPAEFPEPSEEHLQPQSHSRSPGAPAAMPAPLVQHTTIRQASLPATQPQIMPHVTPVTAPPVASEATPASPPRAINAESPVLQESAFQETPATSVRPWATPPASNGNTATQAPDKGLRQPGHETPGNPVLIPALNSPTGEEIKAQVREEARDPLNSPPPYFPLVERTQGESKPPADAAPERIPAAPPVVPVMLPASNQRPVPVVHVTIGRIEVKAVYREPPRAAVGPPAAAPSEPPVRLSLDDYLKRRNEEVP